MDFVPTVSFAAKKALVQKFGIEAYTTVLKPSA
jgi:hypothetical protein